MKRRRRSLSETIEHCQAKLAADPRSLAFAQLADAYRKQGRLDDAIRLCQQGLSRSGNYASAYMVLGRSQQQKGDLLAARDAFQSVLQIDPRSVQALKFLGQIAEARNETADALASYQMASVFHPFDKEVRATIERLEEAALPKTASASLRAVETPAEPTALQEEDKTAWAPSRPAEVEVTAGESPARDPEPLATETMARLYTAQGLHDQAAEIYGRLAAQFPEREDLAARYREAITNVAQKAERRASFGSDKVLYLLETWRDAFRQLRRREKVSIPAPDARRESILRGETRADGPVELLEARRDTSRQLHAKETRPAPPVELTRQTTAGTASKKREPVALLEAWRDAFRRVRASRRGPLELLEAWRNAFRRLKTVE